MKIRYESISDVGRERSNNEDMALVFGAFIRDDAQSSMVPMQSRPRFTALVADGMGGYGGGEIASAMVLASFNEFLADLPDGLSPRETARAVREWLRGIQQAVLDKASADRELANMGTTLTGIFTYGQSDFMINAGDSRVYRWRYDTLRRLTVDHSERERTGDPLVPSNLIYNAIGVPGAFIDVICLTDEMPMIDGDVYVICSDGLCDMIDDDTIASILASGGGARGLVDAALDAGGRDNCTVIVLYVSMPDNGVAESLSHDIGEGTTAELEPEPEPEPEVEKTVETVDSRVDLAPAQGGFEIDEPVSDEPGPPAFIGFDDSVPSPAPQIKVIGEDVAVDRSDADSVQPAAERARQAAGLVREAWNILFGKKK
ncbi:MAG: protein phosphatase 2C domain-containing protein [Bacteroidales bacterium]|nr:protein phosphatase 2C domain-containing protein [Bacteroidales bacterium]